MLVPFSSKGSSAFLFEGQQVRGGTVQRATARGQTLASAGPAEELDQNAGQKKLGAGLLMRSGRRSPPRRW